MFEDLARSGYDWIQSVRIAAGLSSMSAHVHAGLALYLIGQLVFRDRRGSVHALQLVLAVELLKEALDAFVWNSPRWSDTLGDLAATMFWPTAIYAMSVYRRRRWAMRMAALEASIARNPIQALAKASV